MSRLISFLLTGFALFNIINCVSIINTGNAIEYQNGNTELEWEEMYKISTYGTLNCVDGK